MSEPATPRPVFPYEPTPVGRPGDPAACNEVMIFGDSLANEVIRVLEDTYRDLGYCATIIDASANGANPITSAERSTGDRLDRYLEEHSPDAVVFSFVGNVPPIQAPAAAVAYVNLVDRVAADGIPLFVTEPPVSAWLCDPDDVWSRGHQPFRAWVIEGLPLVRPGAYTAVPWSRVLTPGGSWAEFNDSLRFPDGEHRVRHTDCVHLRTNGGSEVGAEVAAREIVAATQGLWAGS